MRVVGLLLLGATLTAPSLLQRTVRESNSAAETKKGISSYTAKDYDGARRSFEKARELAPSSRASFDVGTARLAAGDVQGGNEELARAAEDPQLRAASLFNRGTAALQAKRIDQAISDLTASLRSDPRNVAAKRNLELATREKEKQQQQQQKQQQSQSGANGGGGNQQQPSNANGSQQPQQQPQSQQPSQGKPNNRNEALLRSVEQQEREELRRMRAAGQEKRGVGW